MKGIVIAGTASGVGKTVASLAVMHALETAGYAVQPAKAGPDFIDPTHHETVTNQPSRTLDVWLQGPDGVRRNYYRGTGDVCVVEGMMGLYDGSRSSTAVIAEELSLPVVLVVDASAGMESVAATALGFAEYAAQVDRSIDIAGIIAQRAHGGRHEAGIVDALPDHLEYFGRIPPRDTFEIPERHLGLHLGDESPIEPTALAEATTTLESDRLVSIARRPPKPAMTPDPDHLSPRIAVAYDDAFRFIYPATLERLRELGTVLTFSPLSDDPLPDCDGVYLPGGYPERFPTRIATSTAIADIAAEAHRDLPVFGECGGLMTLAETLTTTDGTTHHMAGILPAVIRMHDTYQALDHVELTAQTATLTATPGDRLHAHEFHYSRADPHSDAQFAFTIDRGHGIDGTHDGLIEYATLGTYAHIHPETGGFDTLVDAITDTM